MRLATFNVQNLRLRGQGSGARFDGAVDRNDSAGALPADQGLDDADRQLTARVIAECNADIVALQEVFDQRTLDAFDARYLTPLGASYPYRLCLEGNDGRSQDVAVVSRYPIDFFETAAHVTFGDLAIEPPNGFASDQRLFRRDCLSVQICGLWCFVCHLKSDGDSAGRSGALRYAEALGIRRLIERRFQHPSRAKWVILGDVNVQDQGRDGDAVDHSIDPLFGGFSFDLIDQLKDPNGRWTHYHSASDHRSCPDRILLSPLLAALNPNAFPHIMRQGMARRAGGAEPRYPECGAFRPRASDHALVWADIATG